MAEHCKATRSEQVRPGSTISAQSKLSGGIQNLIPAEALASHVSCGLCFGPVASSLLLSCSHLFCGDCVFRHLSQEKPCCPTCNMELRAVPVRCLAMDKVAACIVPSLAAEQQQQYAKRKQDGKCAADKVNKMFWYLAPTALPGPKAPQVLQLQGAAYRMAPTCTPLSAPPIPDFPGSGLSSTALSLDHKTCKKWQGMAAALDSHQRRQQQQQQGQKLKQHQVGTSPLQLGCNPAAAAAMPPHVQSVAAGAPLLQLAVTAQHVALPQQLVQVQQQQQQQQQLSAVRLHPACRTAEHGVAAGTSWHMGARHDVYTNLGLVPQPLCVPGYQGLQQLSSTLGGMCRV